MKPIPDDVKNVLGQLAGPQQVVLRKYIATLRSEIQSLNEEILASKDPVADAHFHGDHRCTADHGHDSHDHEDHGHGHG
jgi:hypothetical protein